MRRSSWRWVVCAALLLSACQGGGEAPGSPDAGGGLDAGTPGPTAFTVKGTVLSGQEGRPLANATVLVVGKTAVITDAAGAFSVADVKAPYDIVAVTGNKQSAVLYKGVTREDPTLSIFSEAPFPDDGPSGTVTGTITGARTPTETVNAPWIGFAAASSPELASSFDASTSTYSTAVEWKEGTSFSGTLFVFQTEQDSADPRVTRYTGFGRRDNVTLNQDVTLANQGLTLEPVTSSTLSGTVTAPEDYTPSLHLLDVRFSPALEGSLLVQLRGPNSFSYPVPVVTGTTFSFTVGAASRDANSFTFGSKRGLVPGANDVNLALKPPPSPQQPANAASDVALTTDFSWTPSPEGVNFVRFIRTRGSDEPPQAEAFPFSIAVVTHESHTSIPDLRALGMALPAQAHFTWQVVTLSPLRSVDSFLVRLDSRRAPVDVNEFYSGFGTTRSFGTAATP